MDTSDTFLANAAATTGSGYESRLKIGTADGSWVISPRSYATFRYTHFANETLGRPDNIADVADQHRAGHAARHREPGPPGPAHRADPHRRPDRVQHLHPAHHRPLRLRAERRAHGRRVHRLRPPVRPERLLPRRRPDRLQPDPGLEHPPRAARRVPAVRGLRGPGPQLQRLGRHLACRADAPASRARRSSTPRASSARPRGPRRPSTPSTTPRTSSSTTRSSGGTGPSTSGVIASNDTLFGQGLREDGSTLTGYVLAPGNKYEMYDLPFSKMIQPRVGATWAYNGKDTVYASYARYNPAANSLPRAASWDRNLIGTFVDTYFDANGLIIGSEAGRLLVREAVRGGPRPAEGRRVPGRHRAAAQPQLVGAPLRPLPRGQQLLGGHQQQRARRLQPARRASRASCTSRTSPRGWPRSAAGRPT